MSNEDKAANLRGKIVKQIGKINISLEDASEELFFIKFGLSYGNIDYYPPFIHSLSKDFSLYKNPAEQFKKDFLKLINFVTEVLNEKISERIDRLKLPDEEYDYVIKNGFTGEEIHNIEAIEIITDNNKRIRIFQKFVFPKGDK